MSVYLDASVLVSLIQIEDDSAAVMTLIESADAPLVVSDFAAGEVASAISRLFRMDKIDMIVATDRLAIFDEWAAVATRPIATDTNDIRLAAQFVRRIALGIRMPDAIHLAAAQIRGMTLATRDRRLAVAADQLGIRVITPRLLDIR